ncbi:MAG TPA: pilus assembly protein PilP [Gammaproteobacteria bacterium]|nr:pilus assembly protein PilP [Gammaproteobacteria bacterium]
MVVSSRRMENMWRAAALLMVLLLAGCSDSGIQDLEKFVTDARAQKGRVEPLPEFKPAETFSYSAADLKDPFETWKSEAKPDKEVNRMISGIRPNVNRRKEVLENFPLDTLRLIGSMEFNGHRWGLVKAPDGIIYRVRPDSHLGQNYGRVVQVTENKLVLVEIVPDGLGGWEERQATMSVNSDE